MDYTAARRDAIVSSTGTPTPTREEVAAARLVIAGRATDRDDLCYLLSAPGLAGTKICRDCRQEQTIDQFNRKIDTADGRDGRCRDCTNLAKRRAYEASKHRRRH